MLTLLVAGALAAEPCAPMTPYTAGLKLGEWGATVELAQDVIKTFESQPMCMDTFEPSALRNLYQQAAYIAIISENESLATTWLRRAATADVTAPPSVVVGDTSGILELWDSVAAEVTQGKKGTVKPKSVVWLDGRALLPGQPYQVPIGPHIVQYATHRGMVTDQVQINGGDMLRVGRTNWQMPTTIAGGVLVAGSIGAFLGAQYFAADAYNRAEGDIDRSAYAASSALAGTGAALATTGFTAVAVAALLKPNSKRRAAARKQW